MEKPGAADDAKTSDAAEAARLLSNWHLLSISFSVNQACVSTVLIYTTTLLGSQVGYAGSALLYIFTCVASLFVAAPLLAVAGQRCTLFAAMSAKSVFIGFFAVACALPVNSVWQYLAFVPAACLCGIAGLGWTAQGAYLSRSADLLAQVSEGGRQSATARHSAIFGVYYLVSEVVFKMASSILLARGMAPPLLFMVFLACSLIAVAACLGLMELPTAPRQAGSAGSPLLVAVSLWKDPVLWCIAPLNFAFGFEAAFMNGYVNATYAKPQLGEAWVGYLGAATVLIGAVFSYIFGVVAMRSGTKGPILLIGSASFIILPLLAWKATLGVWGHWLLVPYAIQGVGRSVYESTNRGIFADFFPGDKAEGAFANQMMQSTLSFAVCFFFSATLSKNSLSFIILIFAVAVYPGYILSCRLRRLTEHDEQERVGGAAPFDVDVEEPAVESSAVTSSTDAAGRASLRARAP